ncbi:MAG: hypothetical protein IPK85_04175 [Gemmatimonadetes bacterium]|nr:hypothetical protein [Gemmatimonadota bacterium]
MTPEVSEAARSVRTGITEANSLSTEFQELSSRLEEATDPAQVDELKAALSDIETRHTETMDSIRQVIANIPEDSIKTIEDRAELLYQAKLFEIERERERAMRGAAIAAKPENLELAKTYRQELAERLAAIENRVSEGNLSDLPGMAQVPVVKAQWENEINTTPGLEGILETAVGASKIDQRHWGNMFNMASESARQINQPNIALKAFALSQRQTRYNEFRAAVGLGLDEGKFDESVGRLVGFPASDAKVGDSFHLYDWTGEVTAVGKAPTPTGGVPMMVTKRMEADLRAAGYSQEAIDKMAPQQAWDALSDGGGDTVTVHFNNRYRNNKEPVEFTVPKDAILPGVEGTHSRASLQGEVRKALDLGGSVPEALMERVRQHARNVEIAKADEAMQVWLRLSDEAFKSKTDTLPKMLEAEANAIGRLASLLSAPVSEVASARGNVSKGLIDLGRFLMRTDDATIAVTPFGGMARALDDHKKMPWASEWAHTVDRTTRRDFGYRTGVAHENVRKVKRAILDDSHIQNMRRAGTHMTTDLRAAMKAHNVPDTMMGEVSTGLMARAIVQKQDAKAYFPVSLKKVDGKYVEVPHPAVTESQELLAKTGPEFIAALDRIAADHIRVFDDMGQEALSIELIERTKAGNIPNRASQRARSRIQRSHRSKDLEGSSRTEGFTAERTSTQYRFRDEKGDIRRFFDYELRNLDYSLAQIETMTPVRKASVLEVRDTIDQWRKMQKRLGITEPEAQLRFGRDTDPMEFNELIEGGALSSIMDGPFDRAFVTDAVMAFSARYADQHRAVALHEFHDQMRKFSVDARTMSLREISDGGSMTLDSGQRVKIISGKNRSGQDVHLAEINGRRYRALDKGIIDASHIDFLNKGADPELTTRLYPEEIADAVEGIHMIFASKKETAALMQFVEEATRVWKTTALMHPSWTIVNLFGSLALLTQAGADIPQVIKNFPAALKTVFGGKAEFDIGGKAFSSDDMTRLIHENYVTAGYLRGTDPTETMVGGDRLLASEGQFPNGVVQSALHYKQAFQKFKDRFKEISQAEIDAMADQRIAREIVETRVGGSAFKAKVLTQTAIGPAVKAWFQTNQRLEDAIRLSAMAAWMGKGLDPAAAANKVRRSLFDFADFTQTENNIRRTLLPFYCVPDDAEALTRGGWKHHDELKPGDEMLTYSVEKDELEWKPCLDVARFQHDQSLLSINTARGVTIRCTDEHRWATKQSVRKVKGKTYGGDRRMKEARNLNTLDNIIVAAEYRGTESTLTPDDARLYGWLLTDGYWRMRGNHIEAVIYQHPKKFLAEVTRVAGGKPRPPHPQTGVVCVPVLKARVERLRHLLVLGKAGCTTVPLGLSRDAAEAMFEAMYQAEGSHGTTKNSGRHFAQYHKPTLECFRLLCVLLGKRTSATGARGCYVSDRRTLRLAEQSIEREHYTGIVWCPKTENGTWVMRQGDTITITGNTWMKNNLAFQARQLIHAPAQVAATPKIVEALEEVMAGENQVPIHLRPRWMADQIAVQMAGNPESRWSLGIADVLPSADIAANWLPALVGGVGGAQHVANRVVSGFNPVIKAPVEFAAGTEFFSGRTIAPDSTQGDLSAVEFAASQIRPLREFGVLSNRQGPIPRAAEQGAGALAARTLIGGRSQDFSEGRIRSAKLREYQDRERLLRIAINRAIGEDMDPIPSQAKLAHLYSGMIRDGFGEEVPRWFHDWLDVHGG